MIGNAWGRFSTIRSEYMSPILHREHESELKQIFKQWIGRHSSASYFSFSDVLSYHDWARSVLIRKIENGYQLDTSGDFETYKASLSRTMRLKVFNRRDYLTHKYYQIEF